MNKVLEISNWNHFRPSTGAYNWTYISIMTYISWTLTITHKTCVSCNLLFPYLDLCSQLRKNLLEFPGNVSHIYTGVQPVIAYTEKQICWYSGQVCVNPWSIYILVLQDNPTLQAPKKKSEMPSISKMPGSPCISSKVLSALCCSSVCEHYLI